MTADGPTIYVANKKRCFLIGAAIRSLVFAYVVCICHTCFYDMFDMASSDSEEYEQ